jgi:regulator of RNase E activity RraB
MNNWINVEEYLPEAGELVLCADILNNFISLGKLIDNDDEYCFQLMNIENVEIDSVITHWMELPERPVL